MNSIFTYFERVGELFAEVFATIRRNKLRTSLTGCAVTVGLFLLIFLIGSGNGLIHALEKGQSGIAIDVVQVYPGTTSKPYRGMQSGRSISLDNRDLALSASPSIEANTIDMGGKLSQSGITLRVGTKRVSGSLEGVYPLYADMEKLALASGRFINDTDIKSRRKVVVISSEDAIEMYGSAAKAVGGELRADGTMYKVVGVIADNKGQGNSTAGRGLVPFSTMQTIYNKGKDVESLYIKTTGLAGKASNEEYEKNLQAEIASIHGFDPEDDRALWINNSTTGAEETNEALDIMRTAIWVVGLLTLLSGVVGIGNIMLISVKERTHEFGIRKALGAKPRSILSEVILESIIITLLFGYIGLVLGVAGTEILDMVSHSNSVNLAGMEVTVFENPTVDLATGIKALATLVIAGVMAGYLPARRAVRVKPIEALRG